MTVNSFHQFFQTTRTELETSGWLFQVEIKSSWWYRSDITLYLASVHWYSNFKNHWPLLIGFQWCKHVFGLLTFWSYARGSVPSTVNQFLVFWSRITPKTTTNFTPVSFNTCFSRRIASHLRQSILKSPLRSQLLTGRTEENADLTWSLKYGLNLSLAASLI